MPINEKKEKINLRKQDQNLAGAFTLRALPAGLDKMLEKFLHLLGICDDGEYMHLRVSLDTHWMVALVGII